MPWKRIFPDVRVHGIVSDVTISLHTGCGCTGSMTFVSSRDDKGIYVVFRSEIPHLFLFGYHLHDTVMRRLDASNQANERAPLSEPEKICLLWAAEGKTTWEIGKILSVKERGGLIYLNNAAKKLGAINRQNAIAIVLREIRASITTLPDKFKF